jgi:hypothetical protein
MLQRTRLENMQTGLKQGGGRDHFASGDIAVATILL